jgi:hypothetical protein
MEFQAFLEQLRLLGRRPLSPFESPRYWGLFHSVVPYIRVTSYHPAMHAGYRRIAILFLIFNALAWVAFAGLLADLLS